MKFSTFFSWLSASLGFSQALVALAQPTLTIGLVTETNAPNTLSLPAWASVPVVVDVSHRILFAPAGASQFTASVVCANEPVLAVGLLARAGHTNEVEWSTNLIQWTPSNVRWVSDGLPLRYYLPQPVGNTFYRLKEWNSPPQAQILVFARTGSLFSLSTSSNAPGTQWVVVSPNGTDAEVALQGSPSSDEDQDSLEYFWESEASVFATAASTTNRLALGKFTTSLKVSDRVFTNVASATITTINAFAAVELLKARVSRDVSANLSPRQRQALLATLKAAATAFDRGRISSGVKHLRAFKHKVGELTERCDRDASILILAADQIVQAVTNSGTAGDRCPNPHPGRSPQNDPAFTDSREGIARSTSVSNGGFDPGGSSASGSSGGAPALGCNWSATANQPWLHPISSGTGNGTITCSVDANGGTSARSGTLTVGGQAFTINQAASFACEVVLSPTNVTQSSASGNGSSSLTAPSGCDWSAVANQIWLHTTSRGTGNGTVNFSVDANGNLSPRSGTITVNGTILNINQAGTTAVDGESPTATFLAPASGAVLTGSVSVRAWLTDNVSLASVAFYVDVAAVWTLISSQACSGVVSTNTALFDTTTVPNGAHTLMCLVYDTAGNGAYVLRPVSIANPVPDPGISLWFGEVGRANPIGQVVGTSVKADGQRNVIVVGNFQGTVIFGSKLVTARGGTDIFVAKYAFGTNLLWVQTYGGALDDSVAAVATDAAGNILITGNFYGTANFGGGPLTSAAGGNGSDIFVARYTSDGTHLWSRRMGGPVGNNGGSGIAADPAGNVIVAGQIYSLAELGDGVWISTRAGSSDGFVVKLDGRTGTNLWAANFGGTDTDVVKGVAVDSLGDAVVVGYTYAGLDIGGVATNFGSSDLFMLKYDSRFGSNKWFRVFGSSGADSAEGVAVDTNRNVFITGGYSSTMDLGGISLAAPPFNAGIYLAKYDSAGSLQWARSLVCQTTGGGIISHGIAADWAGNVAIIGNASGGVDFGSGLASYGDANIFVAKYGPQGGYLWAKRSSNTGFCSGFGLATDLDRNVFATGFVQGVVNLDGLLLLSPWVTTKSGFIYKVSP